jgi:2,3-bisphosphoglycerate-independent phosphoglycerate mutase
LRQHGDYRILISPDHPTPIRLKTHSHGAVPFTIAGTEIKPDSLSTYDEAAAAASQLAFNDGWRLMRYFLDLFM